MENSKMHFLIYVNNQSKYIMSKKELEIKIIQLIGLFDYLISINGTIAYHSVKNKYKIVLEKLIKCESIQDVSKEVFDELLNVFRIFMETPTRDVILGQYILGKMQEIYLIQEEMKKRW